MPAARGEQNKKLGLGRGSSGVGIVPLAFPLVYLDFQLRATVHTLHSDIKSLSHFLLQTYPDTVNHFFSVEVIMKPK